MTTIDSQITAAALKSRGWTDALVRDLLGQPDATRTNPYYPSSGPPMRLYSLARVETVEASPEWEERVAQTRKRQEASARAAETKRAKLLTHLETVAIQVLVIDMADLTQMACNHYNERQEERGRYDRANATPSSDREFLERITVNYLRHAQSGYDWELIKIFGRVGVNDGYAEINRRAYEAIVAAYPTLQEECQRQLDDKIA